MWMDNDGDRVRPEVVRMVTAIADALVVEAEKYTEELPRTVVATEVRHVQGVPVMVHDCVPHDPVSSQLRDEWNQEHPGEIIAMSVSHDRRDDGLALYRFDDDPRIDLHRLAGDPRVLYAHPGGFSTKTKERVAWDVVEELIVRAMM
jgi:acetyl esterase/lipase